MRFRDEVHRFGPLVGFRYLLQRVGQPAYRLAVFTGVKIIFTDADIRSGIERAIGKFTHQPFVRFDRQSVPIASFVHPSHGIERIVPQTVIGEMFVRHGIEPHRVIVIFALHVRFADPVGRFSRKLVGRFRFQRRSECADGDAVAFIAVGNLAKAEIGVGNIGSVRIISYELRIPPFGFTILLQKNSDSIERNRAFIALALLG
jgi:hypothetical protein